MAYYGREERFNDMKEWYDGYLFGSTEVYNPWSVIKFLCSGPYDEIFSDMLQKEPSLGYVYSLSKESARMLRATLAGDTETMAQILELTHDTEVPLLGDAQNLCILHQFAR